MKNLLFFLSVLLISFTSCDTLTKYTLKVSIPTLTIVNDTGHPVVVTAPVSANLNHGASTQTLPTGENQNIEVVYRIGQNQFTEQVVFNNVDATVTLTKRPPTITVVNQTGYQAAVTAPGSANIANSANAYFLFQATETIRNINVVYTIERFQFTEQVGVSNTDVTVTLTQKPAAITVVNQTGRPVDVTAPVSRNLVHGANTRFLSALNQRIDINYRSGLMQLTEQATVGNQDITVTLARAAPTLTIVNNIGPGNNVNIIQFRVPNTVQWVGGNIMVRNGELHLVQGTAQTGDVSQPLINGERLSFWLGNMQLQGDVWDIQLQTPTALFQRNNVRVTSDMTLTFTQADRR